MDEFLTVTEAAKLYGCSRPTIWHFLNTDRLPYEMMGRMAVIRKADFDQFVENRANRRTRVSWIEPVRRAA